MPSIRCKYVERPSQIVTGLSLNDVWFYSIKVPSGISIGLGIGTKVGTGDTKAGTLIGMDRFGNKYFENLEDELPCKKATKRNKLCGGL